MDNMTARDRQVKPLTQPHPKEQRRRLRRRTLSDLKPLFREGSYRIGPHATKHALSEGFTENDILDRKSTRLNSSHVAISYAVFCLKKKNHKKKNLYTDR